MSIKHLPSFTKGDISGRTTFTLPSFSTQTPTPWKSPEVSPIPQILSQQDGIFPREKGEYQPMGLHAQSLSKAVCTLFCDPAVTGVLFFFSLSHIHSTFSSLLKSLDRKKPLIAQTKGWGCLSKIIL